MRTLKVAILALGLAALATTGCGKKKDAATTPAAETTTEPAGDMPAGDAPADPANPCGGADGADPCGGGE